MLGSHKNLLPSQSIQANKKITPFCGFCLSKTVLPLNLRTCKHFLFYMKMFLTEHKVALGIRFICVNCHTMLKKISGFYEMILETQEVLRGKVNLQNREKTYYDLKLSDPIHTSYEPDEIEIEIKLEPDLSHPEPIKNENYLKNESDSNLADWLDSSVSDERTDSALSNYEDKETNENGGTFYDINNLINIDAPESITLKNGVQLPVISKTLIGETLIFPKSSLDKVQVITIPLKELMEKNREKTESSRYSLFPFKCTDCLIGFKLENVYKRHMNNHTIMPDEVNDHMICDVCHCVLPAKHSKTHYVKHFTRYKCSECDKIYSSLDCATTHFIDNHEPKVHKCTQCDFTSTKDRVLRSHIRKFHRNKNYKCRICGRTFSSYANFSYHKETEHVSPDEQTPSECPICKKMFKKKSLKKHMYNVHKNDTSDKPYCVECNQYFKTVGILKMHYLNHRNHVDSNQRVQCDYCGKKFSTKTSLSYHIIQVHIPSDKYKCDYCNKKFSLPRFLKRHINRVHLKIRPNRDYICDFCGKGFTAKHFLVNHIRCHTGERPFKCEVCDATFRQSGALYTHNKLVHAKGKKKS